MPVIVRRDALLAYRKMSLTKLSDHVGITLANLNVLKSGRARAMRFSTLAALCRALACQPGKLLAYVPDVEQERR